METFSPWFDAWASFSGWGRLEVGFAILVAIGCVGEMYWIFKNGPRKEEWIKHEEFEKKKTKREQIFALVVAIGVTGEVVTLLHSLKESGEINMQVQTLTSTNLVLRSKVSALEIKSLQISNAVAGLEPVEQPIVDVSAEVEITVKAPNIDKYEPIRSMVSLNFNRFPRFDASIDFPGFFEASDCSFQDLPQQGTRSYYFKFRPRVWFGSARLMDSWLLNKVGEMEKLDAISLHLDFLPRVIEITEGGVVLVVNSIKRRHFHIPAFKTYFPVAYVRDAGGTNIAAFPFNLPDETNPVGAKGSGARKVN